MKYKRFIKPLIIMLIIIGCSVLLWNVSGKVVEKSYDSKEIVLQQEVISTESTTEQGYNTTEVVKKSLNHVDFSGRETGNKELIQNEYFSKKMQEYNDVNGRDMSDVFVMLNSYYYGDYNKYYTNDVSCVLEDYPETLQYINNLSSEDLNRYLESIGYIYLSDVKNTKEQCYPVSMNEIEGLSLSSGKLLSMDEMSLIGVVDDRFYVYTFEKDLSDTSPLLVVDYSTKVSSKVGDDLSKSLYKLGEKYYETIISDFAVVVEKDGRKLIVARGY